MTNDEYLLLNQRVEMYRMIRGKINSLENEKIKQKIIDDFYLILLDEDLRLKITDGEENEVNDTIIKENMRLKNDLDTFTNCLLPRATIQAGEEIKKGNYDLVTIVTNGERCEQKELLDEIAKLNDRHQSDCIEINQLQTTIDVLIDKLARLREVHGL